VKAALGPAFDDNFALWFIDHARHENPLTVSANAHVVSYGGALQQGLRDLSVWVETGVKPAETKYRIVDSQVQVPATARERGGIQSVVDLRANDSLRAQVAAGEPVTFTATIEVPPKAGQVVAAEWDFEGVGNYPVAAKIETPQPLVRLTATHSYA